MWTYKRSWRNKANSGHSSFVEGISFFICKSSWYVVEQCALMVDGVIRARRHVHLYLRHIALWKTSTGAPVTVKPHHSCIKPERFPFEVAPFSFYNFYFFPATLMLAFMKQRFGTAFKDESAKTIKDRQFLFIFIYLYFADNLKMIFSFYIFIYITRALSTTIRVRRWKSVQARPERSHVQTARTATLSVHVCLFAWFVDLIGATVLWWMGRPL